MSPRLTFVQRCALGVLTGIAVLGATAPSQAGTWTVTTTADSSDGACTAALCSLRDAVAAARNGDAIAVPANKEHYTLTLGQIPITRRITIQGASAETSVIDAQGASRLFEITPAVNDVDAVTFADLTLTGGAVTGTEGGAVLGDAGSGYEVFTDVVLAGNSVTANGTTTGYHGGGAISSHGGNVTITHSTLRDNTLAASSNQQNFNGGGAIYYYPAAGGTLSITDSVLSGNSATTSGNRNGANGGGAIYNVTGTLTITGSTLRRNSVVSSANSTSGDNGGGAILSDSGQPVTITKSTVAANTAIAIDNQRGANGGGGILAQAGLTIRDSTIANNTATVADSASRDGGGGILSDPFRGSLTIVSSTISGNAANMAAAANTDSGGGGVLDLGQAGSVYLNVTISGNRVQVPPFNFETNGGGAIHLSGHGTLTNVTIAGNKYRDEDLFVAFGTMSVKSSIVLSCNVGPGGTITSAGYNILDQESCDDAPTDVDDYPALRPLAHYGGPTLTKALAADGGAIDAIPRSACTDQSPVPQPVTVDQRGIPRPSGPRGRCDIGAFESQQPVAKRHPRVRGRARQGRTLSEARAVWAPRPTDRSFAWLRCDAYGERCRTIAGATRRRYTVRAADVGHRLVVRETASIQGGRRTKATSEPSAVVHGRG